MRCTALPTRLFAVVCLLAVVAVVPAAAQKRNARMTAKVAPVEEAAIVQREAAPAVYTAESGKSDPAPLAPTPIPFPNQGTVTCRDLNLDPQNRFPYITEDFEFKLDPPPTARTDPYNFQVVETNSTHLEGGLPSSPQLTLRVWMSSDLVMSQFQLFNSVSPFYLISAVIVKGGDEGTNVYYYEGGTTFDTGPFTVTAGSNAISHISFCLQPSAGPSAAPASVTGRVLDRYGRGISYARVQLFDLGAGETRTAYTNSFGYYRFEELAVGNAYSISVAAKRYYFGESTTMFTLDGDLTGMDFIAY